MPSPLFFRRSLTVVLFLSGSVLLAEAAAPAPKAEKLSVRFLARGTAIYSSFSGNRAEYLVEIAGVGPARLVYRHTSSHPGIPDALIDSGKPHLMRLTRSAACEQSYETMSTAWLPEAENRIVRRPALYFVSGVAKPAVENSQLLPCYLLAARAVRWHGKQVRVE